MQSMPDTEKKRLFGRKKPKLRKEDRDILESLINIKAELDYNYNNFNNITNPDLIDSCIYSMKALHMKYKYYLNLSKERGLAENMFAASRTCSR